MSFSYITRTIFVIFLLLGFVRLSLAQMSIRDSTIQMALLAVSYHGAIPGADMADRFGFTSAMGLEAGYKFRNNFYILGGLRFLFGEDVKELSILSGISNSNGLVVADDGTLADVGLQIRGMMAPVSIGKIFPVIPNYNRNSGFYIELGTQFIQHKIHFSVFGNEVAALSNTHRKGYDRLTNGIGIRESIGFRFFDNKSYVNFSIGIEFSQSFTQNRRSLNIDTGQRDIQKRMDFLNGIHASWIFPIYNRAPNKVYYN